MNRIFCILFEASKQECSQSITKLLLLLRSNCSHHKYIQQCEKWFSKLYCGNLLESIIFNYINFDIFVVNFPWQITTSLRTFFVVSTIVSINFWRKWETVDLLGFYLWWKTSTFWFLFSKSQTQYLKLFLILFTFIPGPTFMFNCYCYGKKWKTKHF